MDVGINLWGSDWLQDGQYLFPTEAEIDYYAAKGFSHIRLPFTWETIQPDLNGKLDANYVALIQKTVDYAKSQGLDVVLDVHNYGSYKGDMIGSADVPVSAFADLWGKIASEFADDTNVRFGLMNEPQLDSAGDWLEAANDAIAAIRNAGANQQVLVPGAYWTGAWSWTSTDNASVIGATGAIVDPAGNYAIEVHQYLDDTSGQNSWVVSETIGVERLTAITQWARAAGVQLYLGEFGVADNAKALAALDNMMQYITKNQDVWESAAYWVGGSANTDYMYSVEPDFGLFDVPQMDVLENFTGQRVVETHLADGSVRRDFYVDGRDLPSMSDVASSNGALMSRTLFDADGDKRSQAVVAANGGLTVTTYDEAGDAFPFERSVYDANHNLLERTIAGDTGAMAVKFYHAGEFNAYREDSYNRSGTLVYSIEHAADGHTVTNYENGVVKSVETYNSAWTLENRESFDAQGRLTQIQNDNADGTHTIQQVNVATGKVYSSTDYSSAWTSISVTSYDSSENPVTRTTTLANGFREIDYFVRGSDALDHSDILTGDNKLVSRVTYSGDSYTTQTYLTPGSSTLSQATIHTLDGEIVSLTKYDANGLVTFVQHYNADGTYSQDNYTAGNQSQPGTVDHFGADNKPISHTVLDANGHAVTVTTVDADGTLTVQYFVAGSDVVSKVETFDANGHIDTRTNFDSHGLISTVQHYSSDGTHTVETYLAANQEHPDTVNLYDAGNKLVSTTQLDDNGATLWVNTIDAIGKHTIEYFVAGTDTVSKIEAYNLNGELESRTTFNAQGLITTIQHDNSDGTHTVETYTDTNQNHATVTDTFNASWAITSRAHFDVNGNLTEIDAIGVDGAHTIQHFTAGSDEPFNVETYTGDWKLQTRVNYDANGSITTIQRDNADGTHSIESYSAGHQDHPAFTDLRNSAWTLVSRTLFDSKGDIASIDTIEADGKHTVENFIAGTSNLSSLEVYAANWRLEVRTNFDANGFITTVQHDNADGTHVIENYVAGNQDNPSFIDQFDASWNNTNRSYYNDDQLTARIGTEEKVSENVSIEGSGYTTLTNKGTIISADVALTDSDGALKLVNNGYIEGDVDLGSGDDVFDVRAGNFIGTVTGGAGNDTFKVSSATINIIEKVGGGIDTVVSARSMTLADNIENLTLSGNKNASGLGNALGNVITGNSGWNQLFGYDGDDILFGGAGRDILTGGNGSDIFEFQTGSGVDTIRDFQDGVDKLSVDFLHSLGDISDLLDHHMRQRGNDLVIDYGSDRLVVENLQASQVTSADFVLA